MCVTVSVITVIHESGDVLGGLIATLPTDVELIIVDNASTDDGAGLGVNARADAQVVELALNVGFGRGCNAGAARAHGDVLVFLNPDCRPEPRAIEVLAAAAAAEPTSIFGPALLHADGALRHNLRRRSIALHEILEGLPSAGRWVPRRWRRDVPADDCRYAVGGDVDYLQGACLAMSAACFRESGGFDGDYFLYSEEESLCSTVRSRGGRCVYSPDAQVRHIGGTSTGLKSAFATYHLFRSRAIFYRKRDGEIRGQIAVIAIAGAVTLSWVLNPLPAMLGRRGAQPRQFHRHALRGLRAGAIFCYATQ
jgi:N-acetylglucosaminyl-diphospho-decaprenol L-rhamnosyltransferase